MTESIPFLMRLSMEIYCCIGVTHLISTLSNLLYSSDYPSSTTHTLTWRRLVSSIFDHVRENAGKCKKRKTS